MTQKARIEMFTWLAAAALGLGVAGCSSASTTGGGTGSPPTTGGGASSGSDQGSASGTGGASGDPGSASTGSSTPAGNSGSAASGASASGSASTGSSSGSGSSSGASSGSTATDDGGSSAMPSRGCGQGTSCTVADDLPAPDAADGFQFVLKSGQVTIQPNQEAYYCYYKTIPGNAAIEVGAFQSWMSKGASHHFITYVGAGGSADGTVAQCAGVAGQWVYATSVSGQIIELKMPDTVGLKLSAGEQFILNMHFINPGTTPISPTLKLNVLFAKDVQYQAGTMISFNAGISVPGGTATAPGMQTVRGTCSAPVGSKFFAITTHTHKHATVTDVNYISGGQTTNIVHTTDWEAPDVGLWYGPDFLTVKQGDSFSYSCTYANTGAAPVTVGETAASNEMCMAIGYYFPAGGASCN